MNNPEWKELKKSKAKNTPLLVALVEQFAIYKRVELCNKCQRHDRYDDGCMSCANGTNEKFLNKEISNIEGV